MAKNSDWAAEIVLGPKISAADIQESIRINEALARAATDRGVSASALHNDIIEQWLAANGYAD